MAAAWCARFVILAVLLSGAAQAEPPGDVAYDGEGHLTVRLERVPLDEVLATVGAETGIEFRGELHDWREVTKRFDDVALPEALRRLIGRQNFVLHYGPDGRPSRVDLLGAPQAPIAKRAVAPHPGRILMDLARHAPFFVGPALQRRIGTAQANVMQIIGGLRHRDAAVRREASQALSRAFDSDATLRSGFVQSSQDALDRLLNTWAGKYTDELLGYLSTQARDPGLRARAASLLRLHSVRAHGSGASRPPA